MNSTNISKILVLYKYLLTNTDESHPVTMNDIMNHFESQGISASDDTIKKYMTQLQSVLDMDIISTRGCYANYYVGNRLFEMEELKLMVDSINASNFVEKGVSKRIVQKLQRLLSIYQATELERSIQYLNIAKTDNAKILYQVNQIQEAFKKDVQIQFRYNAWNSKKKMVPTEHVLYNMFPWALIWTNDRYYLYGYDVIKKKDTYTDRIYRLDKVSDIVLLDNKREGADQFASFNADQFVSRRIGMFHGEESRITVEIPAKLIGAFIDQFGKDIIVTTEKENALTVSFKAVVSQHLLGWLSGLGSEKNGYVTIVEPQTAKELHVHFLQENLKQYMK